MMLGVVRPATSGAATNNDRLGSFVMHDKSRGCPCGVLARKRTA